MRADNEAAAGESDELREALHDCEQRMERRVHRLRGDRAVLVAALRSAAAALSPDGNADERADVLEDISAVLEGIDDCKKF